MDLKFTLSDVWGVDTTGLLQDPEDCPITTWKLCDDDKCLKEADEDW